MNRPRQDLQSVHYPWPRPGEERRRVHGEDVAVASGGCVGQLRVLEEPLGLRLGLLQVVAAGHEDDDLGVGVADLAVGDRARGLALVAEQVRGSDRLNHLRDPVAGGERWLRPFEAEDAYRRKPPGGHFHFLHSSPHGERQLLGAFLAIQEFADGDELLDHVFQRVRVEREDRRVGQAELVERTPDLAAGHGADAAEILGQDHVWSLSAQELTVEHVEGSDCIPVAGGADALAHGGVDLA